MRKLLCANFLRLRKNKLFWAAILVMMGFSGFVIWNQYDEMVRYQAGVTSSDALFMAESVLGVVTAALISLFVGVEYSDGTIRNKIMVGHQRWAVFLSSFVVSAGAAAAAYLMSVLTALVLGACLFPPTSVPAATLAVYFGVGLMMSFCYGAIFHAVTMLCSRKAYAAVACILLSFLLLMGAAYVSNALDQPEYVQQLVPMEETADDVTVQVVGDDGEVSGMEIETAPNPKYLSGAKREVYQFFYDLNPTGQAVQLARLEMLHPLTIVGYDLILICLLNLGGVLLFRKKDLK